MSDEESIVPNSPAGHESGEMAELSTDRIHKNSSSLQLKVFKPEDSAASGSHVFEAEHFSGNVSAKAAPAEISSISNEIDPKLLELDPKQLEK